MQRGLGSKVSQMIIEMLIAENGPLDRSHVTKKAVRMGRGLFWSSRRKPVNPVDQPSLLLCELPLIVPDQTLLCWHISADWPFAKYGFFCQPSNDPPDQTSRRRVQSSCHL
jgi:hypothetical protein